MQTTRRSRMTTTSPQKSKRGVEGATIYPKQTKRSYNSTPHLVMRLRRLTRGINAQNGKKRLRQARYEPGRERNDRVQDQSATEGGSQVPDCPLNHVSSYTYNLLNPSVTVNPLRTAVPFWGQTTGNLSALSPKRDCGSKGASRAVLLVVLI